MSLNDPDKRFFEWVTRVGLERENMREHQDAHRLQFVTHGATRLLGDVFRFSDRNWRVVVVDLIRREYICVEHDRLDYLIRTGGLELPAGRPVG